MGHSNIGNREPILAEIAKIVSNNTDVSVLDLGIGGGNFGKLLKQRFNGKINPLIGVEVWKDYENSQWGYYDRVEVQEIEIFLNENTIKFDIIMLIDVLEHLPYKEGYNMLKKILPLNRKKVIVSTPVTKLAQKAHLGNQYQVHHYIWNEKELEDLGFEKVAQHKMLTFRIRPLTATGGVFVFSSGGAS